MMCERFFGKSIAVVLMVGLIATVSMNTANAIDDTADLKKIPAEVLDRLPVHDKTLVDDTQPGQGQVAKPSYWLGIGVTPSADALRTQLSLPEGVGLTILQVVPDSPAAKAGLKIHDVLIEADGVSLKSQSDLVDAVAKAKENKMRLSVMRHGDDIVVEATPEIRQGQVSAPGKAFEFNFPNVQGLNGEDQKALQQWLQQMQKQGPGAVQPFNFRVFGPAIRIQTDDHAAIPENLSIQVQKSGDKPAKILVQRDNESWDITEDQLDQLPPDIRSHVQRLLGRGMKFQMPKIKSGMFHLPAGADARGFDGGLDPKGFPKIQEQLDEMSARMEQMLDQLRNLQQQEDEPEPDQE